MKKSNLVVSALIALSLVGCIKATGTKKNTSGTGNAVTNPGWTTGPGTGPGTGSGTGGSSDNLNLTECSDAIYSQGATRCYYTLPEQTYSGSGKAGAARYWSSATNLPTAFAPDIFASDLKFQVRIRAKYASAETSFQGRKCSSYTKFNFDKLQVKLMLSKTSDNGLSDNIGTVESKINQWSKYINFNVPAGATGPLVLSVHSIQTDHRCKKDESGRRIYGELSSQESSACNAGTAFYDIPLTQTVTAPTECVAFDVQFSTDYTYSFPAN